MEELYNIPEAIILILCCIFLYDRFGRRPRIKEVKSEKIPTTHEIKRQRKKARRIRKIKRRFRIPYRGKTQIITYDKKAPYIESAWNEVEKEQHGTKKDRGI